MNLFPPKRPKRIEHRIITLENKVSVIQILVLILYIVVLRNALEFFYHLVYKT